MPTTPLYPASRRATCGLTVGFFYFIFFLARLTISWNYSYYFVVLIYVFCFYFIFSNELVFFFSRSRAQRCKSTLSLFFFNSFIIYFTILSSKKKIFVSHENHCDNSIFLPYWFSKAIELQISFTGPMADEYTRNVRPRDYSFFFFLLHTHMLWPVRFSILNDIIVTYSLFVSYFLDRDFLLLLTVSFAYTL